MHRFRKKSDVKRTQAPILPPPQLEQESDQGDQQTDFLLPVTDFRTSLILPDLSRRFSLLRTPAGDPVTFDDLRSKFAEQRAKGAEHSISEEEEDMLLETLGKLRGKSAASNHTPERSEESFSASDPALTEESGSNSSTTIKLTKGSGSSASGSPSRSKRYSNNLFGSGRLRDYTYLRSVGSSRNSAGGSSKTASITPSEESTTPRANTSSVADSVTSSSPPTDSNEEEFVLSHSSTSANDQSSVVSASSSISEPISAAEYRLQKSLGTTGLKRASLALESVIKEIEDEEVDEEIVLPRSTPIPRNHADHHPQYQNNGQQLRPLGEGFVRDSDASMLSSVVEAGMAISSDKPADSIDSNAQRGASPVPIVPGYIPGMPRPMTPRAFESFADEQRSHSTTPRATSPMHGSFTLSEAGSAAASISNILRRDSTSSRQSPRPTTPLFLQRSTHGAHHSISSYTSNGSPSGRYTPIDDGRNRAATDLNSSTNSTNSSLRRPASPLSNPPFHTISSVSSSPSRPTTPSNIVWTVRPEEASPSSTSDRQGRHSRDNSWASEGESDAYGSGIGDTDDDANVGLGMASLNRTVANGFGQPLRSPPRSDSPGPEKGQLSRSWTFRANGQVSNGARPTSPSNGSNGDFGQSQMSTQRNHRSLTPTQNAPRSPTSPTFGGMDTTTSRSPRRASRQNGYATSSPFNLGPLPTLALNPRANRSSSSLESTGSSFHSWEGEKDKLLSVFNDAEVQPAWHEFSRSSSGKSLAPGLNGSSTTTSTRTSPEEDWDPEDIIRGYAGLKKGDFAMIQEKLVSVARTTEHRGSAMRKRRPSTSQSNYSVRDNRQVASPPPASPTVNIYPNSREQQQIHVLNTCVEHNITPSPPIMAPSLSSSSSLDRPNRNLAQVLFGQEEEITELDTPTNAAPSLSHSSSADAPGSIFSSFSRSSDAPEQNPHLASPNASIQGLPSPGVASLNRSPSATRVPPQSPQDQAALALEVRQKAEAATLALRKPPSQEGIHAQPSARKRIDPSQISKPLLVSSSTSVDTIPLKAPVLSAGNGSGSSLKIGSRFRKLRGSLRAKNVLSPEEPAAAGSDSPNPQTANYDPEKIKAPGTPNLSSATEPARFKVPVPSPPASAGPGLKGFMARFRTKRNTDVPQSSSSSISSDHHHSPQIPQSPLSPLAHSQRQFSSSSTQSRTPSHTATSDSTHTVTTPRPDQYRNQISNNVPPSQAESTTSDGTQPENDDTRAINQLFAAATNLGIDQAALNDLLKRSGSLNSRTLLNPNKDAPSSRGNGAGQHLSVPPIQQPNLSSSSGSDYTATPGMFNSSPVSDLSIGNNFLYNEESRAAEEQTERISAKRPDHLRQGKDINTETNPIVRRTLIFADPRQSIADPSMSRRGTVRRRRASVQSASNRSIHDRVPTPPPSKAPQGKRFSHEASPPVPRLPHALGGPADNHLTVPTGQFEKSNSAAYDSLYELYGDSRVPSMMVDANSSEFGKEPPINSEMATGVEVIQLANGDIIWNVVNGLRDEDDESLYTGRNSVGSEYSTRESGENMQVFVKEHVRGSSKGSNASFVSRKKPAGGKGRPETKVLYGSPEQIGRLIENISQGMDAGSFNFSPPYANRSHTQSHGHSTTSSVSTNEWNINEIDNLLNSINRP